MSERLDALATNNSNNNNNNNNNGSEQNFTPYQQQQQANNVTSRHQALSVITATTGDSSFSTSPTTTVSSSQLTSQLGAGSARFSNNNNNNINNSNNINQIYGSGMGGANGTISSVNLSSPTSRGSTSGGGAMLGDTPSSEKKRIGHREVKHGVVLYKKVPTDELKKSIQFGIVHFINERNREKVDRDLLIQDFQVIETIVFPHTGSALTPAHDFNDFKLKVYAPYGFKYLRRKFNLNEVDFMVNAQQQQQQQQEKRNSIR